MATTYKTPSAPANIRISELKVEDGYLCVTAKWDHAKLVTVKDGKSSSKNASKYEAFFYTLDKTGKFKKLSPSTNSATLKIPLSRFYPNTKTYLANDWTKAFGSCMIKRLRVKVRAAKQGSHPQGVLGASAWKELALPKGKAVTAEPVLGEGDNYVKYTFDDPTGIYSGIQREFYTLSPTKPTRSTATIYTANIGRDTREVKENCNLTVIRGGQFHKHVCRIRPYGPQGYGEWQTAYHVFAWPIGAKINYVSRTGTQDSTQDIFNVTFDSNAKYATDRCEFLYLCYCKGTPSHGWGVPDDWSWTDMDYSYDRWQYRTDISNKKPHSFHAKPPSEFTHCEDDEAVFGRVKVCHDNYTEGTGGANAVLIACGNPLAPSDVEFDGATKKLTWSCNSALPGVACALYAMPAGSDADGGSFEIGMVRNPNKGANSFVWEGAESGKSYRIGVRNFAACTPLGRTVWSTCDDSGDDIVWTDVSTVLPAAATGLAASGKGRAELTWDAPTPDVDEVEVSWSSNPDAWGSTDSPSTFTIDHPASGWIVEDDKFSEGGIWYFDVRFHNEAGWGPYCASVTLDMATIPEIPIITLSKESVVPGDELVAGWTYDNEDETEQESATVEWDGGSCGVVGTDVSCEIPTEDLVPGETVGFKASVKGACSEPSPFSEVATLYVRHPVKAELESPETLEALPLTVGVGELGDYSSAILRIVTQMTFDHEKADGRHVLYETGDVIASFDVDELLADFGDGPLELAADLPGSGSYAVTLTVADVDGNIAEASNPLLVAWGAEAELVEDMGIECAPDLSATLAISTGEDWSDGEEHGLLEVYRKTADGYQLVEDGIELKPVGEGFGATVIDPYAPYTYDDAAYRLAKRLPNNTLDWADFACKTVKASGTTIDFDGERLRLPYNNTRSDSWEKPFEQKRHLGGSVTGHWNDGAFRTGTYAADSVRLEDAEAIEAARRLARHNGEAYIRMSRGIGYPCDIEVSISETYESRSVSLSLTCSQIDSDAWGGTLVASEEEVDDGLEEAV